MCHWSCLLLFPLCSLSLDDYIQTYRPKIPKLYFHLKYSPELQFCNCNYPESLDIHLLILGTSHHNCFYFHVSTTANNTRIPQNNSFCTFPLLLSPQRSPSLLTKSSPRPCPHHCLGMGPYFSYSILQYRTTKPILHNNVRGKALKSILFLDHILSF